MANSVSLTVRLENALCRPYLVVRCEEISRVLQEVSNKDAAAVLRRVIESIFGANGQSGWGLRHITLMGHRQEFTHLRNFLSPTGHLLNLTYRLAHDPFHSFLLIEFPIAYLPARARADLEDGTAGVFYASKIQNPGPGKVPSHILLNAFEFYMFHFAYFLVGVNSQKSPLSWVALNDALFPVLLEDYLREFLPCDASIPPGPPTSPISPRGGLLPQSGAANLHLTALVSPIRGRSPGGLDMSGLRGLQVSSPLPHPHPQQHHVNIWTSQVVAQILLEMWVNHSIPSTRSMRSSQQMISPSSSNQFQQEVFVPTNDHVRAVRILVKHLHYFSNSIKPGQPSALDELKKNLWTMCRKSLYQFLKHMFNHWPLDSSFRLVLETWLSYIQPWRYTDYTTVTSSPIGNLVDNDGKIVDAQWKTFISENILFYTLLTQQLLGRLLRLDLSAPKNANILYRLSKVFSQCNLSDFIQEIETALESSHQLQRCILTPGPPRSDQENIPSPQCLAPIATKSIVDLEGCNHVYVSLFSQQVIIVVNRLQISIQCAHHALGSELALSAPRGTPPAKGITTWISSFLHSLVDASSTSGTDSTVEELEKTMVYLHTSLKNISSVFNLMYPLDSLEVNGCNDTQPSSGTNGSHIPEQVNTPFGLMLSNYGRMQLLKGMRRFDLKFEGDQELRPICTYEVAQLVRWLYKMSSFINKKYDSEIKDLFYRSDFIGRISRVVISSPQTCYEYIKGPFGSPHKKVAQTIPPRISLRFMANKQNLFYTVIFYLLFGVIMGYSTPGMVIKIIFPCLICYILTAAIISPSTHPPKDLNPELSYLQSGQSIFTTPLSRGNRG